MADFEQLIEAAIASNDLPGCVLNAVNRDGTFTYQKAFGTCSVGPDSSPLTLSSIMWIASCTKLMTSICALQLVERGQLTLDAPIYSLIPELQDRPILTGFTPAGLPIQTPHTTPITLRHLLTHSSGLAYDSFHPLLIAWAALQPRNPSAAPTLLERFSAPLVFQPGTSWMYGPSIDYVGLAIERATNLSLEDVMNRQLWSPLGIKNMTFHLTPRPDLAALQAEISLRDAATGKMRHTGMRFPYQDADRVEVEDCMGGQGVFASPEEYVKVLQALLTADEDEGILKKETVDVFFAPQLSQGGKAMLGRILADEATNDAMGGTLRDVGKDWGLGGLLLCGDGSDGKREGTMIWGGLPNLSWFCDRRTGLAGIFSAQVLPMGDAIISGLQRKFELAMYEQYSTSRDASPRL